MADPFTIALAVVGVGFSAFGASKQIEASKEMKNQQQEIVRQEQAAEAERKKQMELDARRKQMEIIRQQQRARSMALATATAQGAAQGSGLMGGYGQIGGVTGTNLLGVQQNLEIGRNLFGINQNIGNARINYAGAQAQYGMGSGISSLGGAIISNLGTLSSLGKSAFYGGSGGGQLSYTDFGTGQGSWPMYGKA